MSKGINVPITAGGGGTPVTYSLDRNIDSAGWTVVDASIAYTASPQTYQDSNGGIGFTDGAVVDYRVSATNADGTSTESSVVQHTVSTSAYEPHLQADIELALLSNTALPIDVSSAADGTGGNPMLTGGGTYTDPTNSSGWNAFTNTNNEQTKLTSPITLSSEFTDIIYLEPTSLTQLGYTLLATSGSGAQGVFGQGSTSQSGKCAIVPAGDSYDYTIALNNLSVGVKTLVTITKNTAGETFVQFNDDTPLSLYSGGISGTSRSILIHGGLSGQNGRGMNTKIGRRIVFSSELTGTALADAKQWVMDGDLT